MARKYVRGYSIEDIKVGMKIKDKDEKGKMYGIIKNIDDVHNVTIYYYDENGRKVGAGFYCFDKKCEYEYDGGKIDILNDN